MGCASLTRRAGPGGGRGPEPLTRPSLSLSAHLQDEADPAPAPKMLRGLNAQTRQALRMATLTHTGLSFSRCHGSKDDGRAAHAAKTKPVDSSVLPLGSRAPASERVERREVLVRRALALKSPGLIGVPGGRAQAPGTGSSASTLSLPALLGADWPMRGPLRQSPQEPETSAQSQGFRHQMALVRPGPGGARS